MRIIIFNFFGKIVKRVNIYKVFFIFDFVN